MIQLPEKPWSEGDTFTNDNTGVEYTFDGVKWLASGAEDDGASQEEKVALIEAQIQYRGLLTLDADGKPVWPADQTKDRGGWWAYPTSTTGSGWNYNALQWIFTKDGDVNDVAKAAAPKYEVGDIIQLQVSENEAGAGTSWQYFDTAPVFVEYMVEEVYYPDTLSGNSQSWDRAYRVSMSGPAHRYTGRLPKVVKGLEGDPSDAWIQWYPTTFAFGTAIPETDLSDYVKQSESWDMSLGTTLGVNQLKPLDGGTPFVYYEPTDYNNTHPCGIVNRGLMMNYVGEEIEKVSSSQPEIPEWTLAHHDSGAVRPGKMAFFDGDFKGTNRLGDARGVVFSATDANGNRVGRNKDGVDWQRDFGGALNILYDEEKTILSMARSHGSVAAVIYYIADLDAYMIIWVADKDAVVTSNVTHVNIDQNYKIHCPEIIF